MDSTLDLASVCNLGIWGFVWVQRTVLRFAAVSVVLRNIVNTLRRFSRECGSCESNIEVSKLVYWSRVYEVSI